MIINLQQITIIIINAENNNPIITPECLECKL